MRDSNTQGDTLTDQLPPEIQAKLDKLEQLEAAENERKGQYQDNLKRVEERVARDNEKREARVKALESHLLKQAAESAIRHAKGNIEALIPHVLPHLIISESRGGAEISIGVRASEATRGARTATELVDTLREHQALGLLFENSTVSSGFRAANEGIVRITDAEAKDPKVYQRLKARMERGEISAVVDPRGRRLI